MTSATLGATPLSAAGTPRRELPRHFFTWMAVVCMAVAFIGFTPTYWLPVSTGSFGGAPIFHIHGLLFSFWTIFFVAQAALASSGRLARHRAVGLVGISLATAMVIVGCLTAIASLRHSIALGFGDGAMAFSVVPLTGIVVFAVLFVVAIANARRRDVHKRLMLVATASLLQAAAGRIFLLFLAPPEVQRLPFIDRPPPPVAVTIGPGVVVDLIIVAGMIFDWRTRGRPHAAYVIGGAFVLAVQLLRVPLSTTEAWRSVAEGVLALAR